MVEALRISHIRTVSDLSIQTLHFKTSEGVQLLEFFMENTLADSWQNKYCPHQQ